MRRALVALAVLLLVGAAWFLIQRDRSALVVGKGEDAAAAPAEELDAVRAKERQRAKRAAPTAREHEATGFLAQWPEIGQDRPQDPALSSISGRVFAAVEAPIGEAVVESSRGGEATARARTRLDGSFLLKNVPPGPGVELTARAAGYAPGGCERLSPFAGKTLDVGVVYLGAALDPDATNRIEVRVTQADKPVPGAVVTATSTLAGALVALGAWEKQPGGTVIRQKTDEKGAVVFEKLPPNFYDFFCEAEGLTFVARQRVIVQKDTATSIELAVSPALTIEGKVVDEDGKPLADARVGALNFANFTMNPVTTTGDDGAFVLGGLASGNYWLFAVKPGRGEKDVQNVEAGRKGLVVTLSPGAAMSLKVLDSATSQPIREFAVRPFKNQPFAYVYSPSVHVKADDGVWRQALDKGSWGVEVTAAGYAMRSVASVPLDAKDPVEVKLDSGAVLHGRVVAKTGGGPVRGARIYVKRGGFPPTAEKDQQTTTDGAGDFVLTNLARGALKVTIAHVDHTEQSFDAEPAPRGDGGALPPAVEFALGDGGRVVGHAFGPGHASIAGRQIALMKDWFSPQRQASIGADGAYEFKNVPPDKYVVTLGGRGGQTSDVEVLEGQTVTADFGSETGGQKVSAKVVRGEDPVANFNVTLDGGGRSVRGTSDAAGRVAFEAVQPGTYKIAPSFLASSASVQVEVKAEEPPAEVVLALPVVGSIEVRVVDDSTGKPLNGAWVNFEQTSDASGAAPHEVRANGANRPTGDEGVCLLSNLEAGRYLIRCWRDPYGSEMLEDVALAAGETKTGVEVRLAAAGSVSGAVRTAAGDKPIEGAAVHLKDAKGRSVFLIAFANTSADGSYMQGQVKPGVYDMTIEKDGFAPATQQVAVVAGKDAHADFKLLMGGWIDVVATKADDTAIVGASVELYDAAGRRVEKGLTFQNIMSSSTSRTGTDGKITLKGVAAGQYRVDVIVDGATTLTSSADVAEGAGTRAEVKLPR